MLTESVDRPPLVSGEEGVAGRRPIGVLIVDDHPAVRMGIRKLLEDQPDMLVVAEATGATDALAERHQAIDVAVLDYDLGARDGLWLTARLKESAPAPRVLIYSAFADGALAVAAVVAGADGMLSKGSLGEELCTAVRALARGRTYLPAVAQPTVQALGSRLGPRDHAIFGMLLAGVAPAEVAQRLAMPDSELPWRRGSILRALGLRTGWAAQRTPARAPLDYDRPRR